MQHFSVKSVNISVLFTDILHSLKDTESLVQISPEDAKYPLGLLDELNIKSSEPDSVPLESLLDLGDSSHSCMDNPFFEQFMDLDQLFPELPLLDTLNTGFEMEETSPVAATSDTCQSDVVTVAAGSTGGEYMEVPSPGSAIIDVVSLESDAEVPSSTGDLSDVALSPESVVDIISVEEDDPGSVLLNVYQVIDDCDQREPVSENVTEEITVIQASDALTLLTRELTQSSNLDASELMIMSLGEGQVVKDSECLPAVTVDIDELFSLSDSLGLVDNAVLLSNDELTSSKSVVSSSVSVKAEPKKRKSTCSETCELPAKKVKCDNADKDDAYSELLSTADVLDKRTVRRLKNNIASKHARAARRQKEQDLFQQEEELEKSNAELRKQVKELEQLTTMLRKVLVEKLSGVTCPV